MFVAAIFTKEISFTTFLSYKVVGFQIFSKSKRWEIICPCLWQGHCSRLTKEYSNFIEWKATQSKQTPKPLSRHPSPAGLRCSPLLLSSRYSREMCISHTGVVQQGLPGRGFASGWTGRRTRGYINTHTAAACHILTAGCLGAISQQLRATRAKSKTELLSFCTARTSGFFYPPSRLLHMVF